MSMDPVPCTPLQASSEAIPCPWTLYPVPRCKRAQRPSHVHVPCTLYRAGSEADGLRAGCAPGRAPQNSRIRAAAVPSTMVCIPLSSLHSSLALLLPDAMKTTSYPPLPTTGLEPKTREHEQGGGEEERRGEQGGGVEERRGEP